MFNRPTSTTSQIEWCSAAGSPAPAESMEHGVGQVFEPAEGCQFIDGHGDGH